MNNKWIKRRKGMTLAQVLFYAIVSVMVFTMFFASTSAFRGANLNLVNQNDLFYQSYNLDSMIKEIKFASEITSICSKGDLSCDDTMIEILKKDGSTYASYKLKDRSIVSLDSINGESSQFYNIESVSFNKIVNSTYNMKLVEVNIVLSKGNSKYSYHREISPNAWINKTVGVDL